MSVNIDSLIYAIHKQFTGEKNDHRVINTLKLLQSFSIDLDIQSIDNELCGSTALMAACKAGMLPTVEWLLGQHVDVEATDLYNHENALAYALLVVPDKPSVDMGDSEDDGIGDGRRTRLLQRAYAGKIAEQQSYEASTSIDIFNTHSVSEDYTSDRVAVIEALLKHGAFVDREFTLIQRFLLSIHHIDLTMIHYEIIRLLFSHLHAPSNSSVWALIYILFNRPNTNQEQLQQPLQMISNHIVDYILSDSPHAERARLRDLYNLAFLHTSPSINHQYYEILLSSVLSDPLLRYESIFAQLPLIFLQGQFPLDIEQFKYVTTHLKRAGVFTPQVYLQFIETFFYVGQGHNRYPSLLHTYSSAVVVPSRIHPGRRNGLVKQNASAVIQAFEHSLSLAPIVGEPFVDCVRNDDDVVDMNGLPVISKDQLQSSETTAQNLLSVDVKSLTSNIDPQVHNDLWFQLRSPRSALTGEFQYDLHSYEVFQFIFDKYLNDSTLPRYNIPFLSQDTLLKDLVQCLVDEHSPERTRANITHYIHAVYKLAVHQLAEYDPTIHRPSCKVEHLIPSFFFNIAEITPDAFKHAMSILSEVDSDYLQSNIAANIASISKNLSRDYETLYNRVTMQEISMNDYFTFLGHSYEKLKIMLELYSNVYANASLDDLQQLAKHSSGEDGTDTKERASSDNSCGSQNIINQLLDLPATRTLFIAIVSNASCNIPTLEPLLHVFDSLIIKVSRYDLDLGARVTTVDRFSLRLLIQHQGRGFSIVNDILKGLVFKTISRNAYSHLATPLGTKIITLLISHLVPFSDVITGKQTKPQAIDFLHNLIPFILLCLPVDDYALINSTRFIQTTFYQGRAPGQENESGYTDAEIAAIPLAYPTLSSFDHYTTLVLQLQRLVAFYMEEYSGTILDTSDQSIMIEISPFLTYKSHHYFTLPHLTYKVFQTKLIYAVNHLDKCLPGVKIAPSYELWSDIYSWESLMVPPPALRTIGDTCDETTPDISHPNDSDADADGDDSDEFNTEDDNRLETVPPLAIERMNIWNTLLHFYLLHLNTSFNRPFGEHDYHFLDYLVSKVQQSPRHYSIPNDDGEDGSNDQASQSDSIYIPFYDSRIVLARLNTPGGDEGIIESEYNNLHFLTRLLEAEQSSWTLKAIQRVFASQLIDPLSPVRLSADYMTAVRKMMDSHKIKDLLLTNGFIQPADNTKAMAKGSQGHNSDDDNNDDSNDMDEEDVYQNGDDDGDEDRPFTANIVLHALQLWFFKPKLPHHNRNWIAIDKSHYVSTLRCLLDAYHPISPPSIDGTADDSIKSSDPGMGQPQHGVTESTRLEAKLQLLSLLANLLMLAQNVCPSLVEVAELLIDRYNALQTPLISAGLMPFLLHFLYTRVVLFEPLYEGLSTPFLNPRLVKPINPCMRRLTERIVPFIKAIPPPITTPLQDRLSVFNLFIQYAYPGSATSQQTRPSGPDGDDVNAGEHPDTAARQPTVPSSSDAYGTDFSFGLLGLAHLTAEHGEASEQDQRRDTLNPLLVPTWNASAIDIYFDLLSYGIPPAVSQPELMQLVHSIRTFSTSQSTLIPIQRLYLTDDVVNPTGNSGQHGQQQQQAKGDDSQPRHDAAHSPSVYPMLCTNDLVESALFYYEIYTRNNCTGGYFIRKNFPSIVMALIHHPNKRLRLELFGEPISSEHAGSALDQQANQPTKEQDGNVKQNKVKMSLPSREILIQKYGSLTFEQFIKTRWGEMENQRLLNYLKIDTMDTLPPAKPASPSDTSGSDLALDDEELRTALGPGLVWYVLQHVHRPSVNDFKTLTIGLVNHMMQNCIHSTHLVNHQKQSVLMYAILRRYSADILQFLIDFFGADAILTTRDVTQYSAYDYSLKCFIGYHCPGLNQRFESMVVDRHISDEASFDYSDDSACDASDDDTCYHMKKLRPSQ